MRDDLKLTSELVPSTSWYNNVRTNVTEAQWDLLRGKCYREAQFKCQICGDVGQNQGVYHTVEAHELWEYDDINKTQTLTGLMALCPYCHKAKHPGLANIKGETHIVIRQLMKVNDMREDEADDYLDDCFEQWEERSEHDWELNIEFIDTYLDNEDESDDDFFNRIKKK